MYSKLIIFNKLKEINFFKNTVEKNLFITKGIAIIFNKYILHESEFGNNRRDDLTKFM